ncbi:MAG: fused MFS/spermidine synthase [Gammaproteobacteria bacterium]|nr:fused MFS/spermidine synthase [Gammaproteobacteria bacterium]
MGAERRIGPAAATVLLLVEGYCSLAIEMTALRVLVPVAGQSVGTTAIVVTAFLAALALGYGAGGRFEGDPAERTARNLAWSAAWSAFWLSHFGVAFLFGATAPLPVPWQVGAYAAVGVGPAAYLLAQTVVLLVGSGRGDTAAGKAGGAFSASTLGNVAGGLLTALVVMQHLGVAASVALVTGLLLLAALAVRDRFGWRLWAAGTAAAVVVGANLAAERNAYVLSTAHADYAVETDADGVRFLRVNGQNASREDGGGIGHPYIEWIEDEVYGDLPGRRPARVLVIGAGGFTFGRGRPARAAEIVYVDVDPRLPEAADAFLGPGPRGGDYVAMDGRAYLVRHEGPFDAIVLDAFADRATTPAHLQTRGFFALARSRLAEDGGTLYMNRIEPPRPDRLAVRVDRTLRSVFAWCDARAFGAVSAWRNRVYACERNPLDGDATVYADGGARGEVDGSAAPGPRAGRGR